MRRFWASLFAHYRDYHAYGPPRLKYMGYLGVFSLVLFYFIRFTRPNAPLFDDIVLRGAAIVMLSLLALKDQWPESVKRYYLAYSYVAILYCLPCFSVLVALQRGGGMPAVSNAFITLCFLVLLTDWRNTLVMLAGGTALAAGLYVASTPNPRVPMDLIAQLPAFALVVIGGNLFKFSTEQIDAERKLRATQALAGSIAHEMRNPLGQIRHNLERMQQALPPPTTTAQAQALEPGQLDTLYRHVAESEMAVQRGLQVIAMTLDEVSAKPVDTTAFSYLSAGEATAKAVQEYAFESESDAAKVTVRVEEDFSFRGDETAYLFVVFNLIKNALYYLALRPQALVTITIGHHQVKVHDTGPGIAPEGLAQLFQPFSSMGKSKGTGLGLAYCRRVMRAFGGDIVCESVLGEYTLFTLTFPPVGELETQGHRSAVLERVRAAFAGKRILIVDDDAAQRMTTRHKLQPLGVVVDQAADGQRALDALATHRYDMLLLDLKMPVLDGYAVAERVRQGMVPLNRDVRIVAYTSEAPHLAAVKTAKAGMDGFISKPCAQLPLMEALHQALERRRFDAQAQFPGRRVLLADDSPHNRKAVAAYLKHAGAAVTEAGHGQDVLEHLAGAYRYDAILMDISMPGMDGMETARAIRSSACPWRGVPIVALTAHSGQATVQAALASGMNDYLVKPVDAAVLYHKLSQLMDGAPATVPAPVAVAQLAVAPASNSALLNLERLESYRRLGILQELLDDYLPELARLVLRLEAAAVVHDLPAALDALHSLLGLSGEAGAQALYQQVRRIYVPMVETQSWPASAGWVAQIEALRAESQQALSRHSARPTAASPAKAASVHTI